MAGIAMENPINNVGGNSVPKTPDEPNGVSGFEQLCKALNMDPCPRNKLQVPNTDFLQEMLKLPVDFTAVPSGTDVYAMRKWIDECLLDGPLAKVRQTCNIERRRSTLLVEVKNISVSCSDGKGDYFTIRTYVPRIEKIQEDAQPRPVILMLHGGGWIHGRPEGDEAFSTIFASELRAVVLGIDYRLAPEHPFPAALDDCCEALDWITRHAAEYNMDPTRIAVWGGSAGGNLAAALAIKESQMPLKQQSRSLRLVSLVVPVTAHPQAQIAFARDRKIEKSRNEQLFENSPAAPEVFVKELEKLYDVYTGGPTDPYNPLVSPLMSEVDSRHPPTHVTVAACDFLNLQGLAYAQHLRMSGVKVNEEVLPGVPHGFTFPLNADVSKRWLERQIDAFARAFAIESV